MSVLGSQWKQKFISLKPVNFSVFSALLAGFTITSLLLGLLLMAYFNLPFNAYISAPAADRPYVRDAADVASKVFGKHFFGDFVQTQDWSVMDNPWTDEPDFLAQYPSVPVYLLKLTSWMPYFASLFIYLGLMFACAIAAVWYVTPRLEVGSRVLLAVALGISTPPMLMAFDRGNNVGFIGAIFGVFAFAIIKNHRKTALVALSLLIAIKIYPIVLLVVFIRKRWLRETLITTFAAGFSTLVLFLVTPGNPIETISRFIGANVKALGKHDQVGEMLINQMIAGLGLVDSSRGGFAQLWLESWNTARWVCLALALVLILTLKRLSDTEVLLLSGFAMMFSYSAALAYNWTWAPIFLALLINHLVEQHGNRVSWGVLCKSSPVLLVNLIGLAIISIPTGWVLLNTKQSAVPHLGWALGVISLAVVIFDYAAKSIKLNRQTVSAVAE